MSFFLRVVVASAIVFLAGVGGAALYRRFADPYLENVRRVTSVGEAAPKATTLEECGRIWEAARTQAFGEALCGAIAEADIEARTRELALAAGLPVSLVELRERNLNWQR